VSGATIFNGGIAQNIPWGGGSFAGQLNNQKSTSTAAISFYNPSYSPIWTAQYTQPLMRGFKTDSTRQQLQITKINRDITDVELRATISNTLANVREAYWNYVYAVQSVDVAQQSVDLANQLVGDNQTRVQVGTMAPIDVVSAQSQAATARQNLVVAQSSMRTLELALKQLMVSGTSDPLWNATIDPVDRPEFAPETVDVQAAVRRALDQRTDLDIVRKTVASNDVTVRYLKDQLLPQADLVANYGLSGIGGTLINRAGGNGGIGGNAGTITSVVPGGYGDALSSLWGASYPRWTLQVNLSYPLGLSSQQAAVARARVQQNQVGVQLKQAELQVATDVTNAAISMRSNVERVQAAQAARDLADQTMRAEQSKFAVGMSTSYNVILTQRDLATAQINELQAVLNYRISVEELNRLQQTTLNTAGVTIIGPATTSVR
jgi:outer membrane protein TolC